MLYFAVGEQSCKNFKIVRHMANFATISRIATFHNITFSGGIVIVCFVYNIWQSLPANSIYWLFFVIKFFWLLFVQLYFSCFYYLIESYCCVIINMCLVLTFWPLYLYDDTTCCYLWISICSSRYYSRYKMYSLFESHRILIYT